MIIDHWCKCCSWFHFSDFDHHHQMLITINVKWSNDDRLMSMLRDRQQEQDTVTSSATCSHVPPGKGHYQVILLIIIIVSLIIIIIIINIIIISNINNVTILNSIEPHGLSNVKHTPKGTEFLLAIQIRKLLLNRFSGFTSQCFASTSTAHKTDSQEFICFFSSGEIRC